MVPLLAPTVAVAVFTLAVTVPLFEPETGLTVNQLPVLVAVHVPVELIVTD